MSENSLYVVVLLDV